MFEYCNNCTIDFSATCAERLDVHVYCLCVLGIRTDEPSVFANSWAVDLPHERACPSVDLDFNGPCHSESDMDVRTTDTLSLLCIHVVVHAVVSA